MRGREERTPIAKSETTIELERDIWRATKKLGVFGCFEVTIGWYGDERVDYITYDTKGIWRCYELKVSKSDFYSKAKKTFVGHYNYYVLPSRELYEQVQADIPKHIGVYIGYKLIKKAKRQELQVDEQVLKDSMIRSLSREFETQFKSRDPAVVKQLKRTIDRYKKERDQYKQRYYELMRIGHEKYGSGWCREAH